MIKRRLAAIALFVLLAGTAAHMARGGNSAVGSDDQSTPVRITIDNFSFTPKEVTVPKGATITWVNQDDVPHTVVSTDRKFRSKAIDTNEQFSFTFSEEGTYGYFCSVHPVMMGKIIVK